MGGWRGSLRADQYIILVTIHNGEDIPQSYIRLAEMTNKLNMTDRTCDVAACRVYQEAFFFLSSNLR